MKTLREMMDLIESAQAPVAEGGSNDLTPYEAGEADGLSGEYYENPYPEGSKSYAEFRLGWGDGTKQSEANRDIDEAIGKNDLLNRLQKDLPRVDDPKNKDAEPVKWTGPGPDDYGYTGYQGHGMPTDKQERARIRADKKKGLPEDEATAKMGLMSAMGSNHNNPADQRRAMAQQAVERLATKR